MDLKLIEKVRNQKKRMSEPDGSGAKIGWGN
jgi:hypothetical protein